MTLIMKKNILFSIIVLVSAIAFLAAPSLKASSENFELFEDLLCDDHGGLVYCDIFEINKLAEGSLYQVDGSKTHLDEIISYLAQHEQSPPAV